MTTKSGSMWRDDGTLRNVGEPDWLIKNSTQTLMSGFEDAGFQIYAVGGCVRDTVLDRGVKDVDLSTDARPDDTIRVIENLATFKDQGWKAIPTGIEHGTITAIAPITGESYEITTFRTDVETDGRHAEVAFSDSMNVDAFRRDFTINAFYADRRGKVFDIVGGSADLKARRIRFIGDPAARIEEDYLRILRFFRFTASHGKRSDGIDAEGLAACALLADGLAGISRERIGAEMTRLMGNWNIAPIVGSMEQSGVLNRILPGASVLTLARLIDLEESYPIEGRTIPAVDVPTRLASLGCDDVAGRLRLSKSDAKKIDLVKSEAGSMMPPHELGYRHGYWPAVHCLLLRWASLMQPFNGRVLADVSLGDQAVFPITASDLMPAYSGKRLGDRLKYLESEWVGSKFILPKSDLLGLP